MTKIVSGSVQDHPFSVYISTMPKTLWGSLRVQLGISTDADPRSLDLSNSVMVHVCLLGPKIGEGIVVLTMENFGDGGIEIHPAIAQDIGLVGVESITEEWDVFLDKIFLSKAFRRLCRTVNVMFTRDIKPYAQRHKK